MIRLTFSLYTKVTVLIKRRTLIYIPGGTTHKQIIHALDFG